MTPLEILAMLALLEPWWGPLPPIGPSLRPQVEVPGGPAPAQAGKPSQMPWPPLPPLAAEGWLGYRFTSRSGSLGKVGEYDPLSAGPQGGLSASGFPTWGFWKAVGAVRDQKDADVLSRFEWRRRVRLDLNYNRMLHRLEHDPLTNLVFRDPAGSLEVNDREPGREYEVVWSELKPEATITFPALPRLKVFVRHRLMRRKGHDQARTISHCNDCHVEGATRRIDQWTNEIEAGFEQSFDTGSFRYAHTFRDFEERAEAPRYRYPDPPPLAEPFFPVRGVLPFGVVPDHRKNVDRFEARKDLGAGTALFGDFLTGRTQNRWTGETVDFHAGGARLTASPWSRVRTTARIRHSGVDPDVPASVDRSTLTAGADATWRLASAAWLETGYAWELLERDNVIVRRLRLDGPLVRDGLDSEKNTVRAALSVTPHRRITPRVRYKFERVRNPLVTFGKQLSFAPESGANPYPYVPGIYPDLTNQPEVLQEGVLSTRWDVTDRLSLTPAYTIRRGENDDVNMTSRDDIVSLTAGYTPEPWLHLTASWSYLEEDTRSPLVFGMTGGKRGTPSGFVDLDKGAPYTSRSQVVLLGGDVRPSDRLGFHLYVADTRSFAEMDTGDVSGDVGGLSAIHVRSYSVAAGMDLEVRKSTFVSLGYQFSAYGDREEAFRSGRSHVFLFRLDRRF